MNKRLLRILERDEWQCRMPVCLLEELGYSRKIQEGLFVPGHPLGSWDPSVDHIKPRALGGRNNDENLRAAHRRCNEFAAKPLVHDLNKDAKRISRLRKKADSPVYDRIRQAERDGVRRGPWGGIILDNPEDVLGGKEIAEKMRRRDADHDSAGVSGE